MSEFKTYSHRDLLRLARDIEREITKRTESAASKVLREATKLARAAGLELSDLFPRTSKPGRGKKTTQAHGTADGAPKRKARAKYANPADPTQKWTGRGRKPRWVEAHLVAGGQLEDLSIRAQRAASKDIQTV